MMENMENNNDKLMETFAIDDFSDCHSTDELLHSYFDRLNALSEYAGRNYAIEPTEFYEMLIDELQPVLISNNSSSSSSSLSLSSSSSSQQCHHNSLNKYRKNQSTPTNTTKSTYKALKQYLFFAGIVCILIVLVNYHTNVSRLFMRNIQTLIYPGMRYWRKLTLPIIREFPQLTNLYDESCLLSNPFFYVAELDCTPCMNVINVVDLSGYLGHFDNSIPHIIKQANECNEREITILRVFQLYQHNRRIFQQDAYKVQSTDNRIADLDGLFNVIMNGSDDNTTPVNSHSMWRINRMAPARVLRALFPSPKTIPRNAGIDIERIITFDFNGGIPYRLPTTDCSNMFMYQAIGSRVIHLQPTNECAEQCRRLTVKLEQNYTLFYDWWYWKPISTPSEQHTSTDVSVSYIGSYC